MGTNARILLFFILRIFKVCADLSGNTKKSFNISSDVCGSVFMDKIFVIESPEYPKNYPPNLECDYFIRGLDLETKFTFEFLDFDLENSVGCIKDRLEVGNLDALCGSQRLGKIYFSKNGRLHLKLKSDEVGGGRGFKILVSASKYEGGEMEIEDQTRNFEMDVTTDTSMHVQTFDLPFLKGDHKQCCQNYYDAKQIIFASPNFPYSLNAKTECTFTIKKANDNVCRLRINFLVFWLGTNVNSYNCPLGYLKLDDKHICGCNSNLKVTTYFDSGNLKTLTFRSEGVSKLQSGFVVEVIQDECPKKYHPLDGFQFPRRTRRHAGPNNIQQRYQLVKNRTESAFSVFNGSNQRPLRSIYFFTAPEDNEVQQDIEETSYLEASTLNQIVSSTDVYQCTSWNEHKRRILYNKFGRELESCRDHQGSGNIENSNCVELDYMVGFFKSPGYPYFYPSNLDICYRFKKQPGYCAIRIFMKDFQIQNSIGCGKDYLLVGNYNRHCGASLFHRGLTLDLRQKNQEVIRFVSDGCLCGRGFLGVYQQIACQDGTYPISPIQPTTERPICDRLIHEKHFTIEVGENDDQCMFVIWKYSEDVCGIILKFENFDLACTAGSVVVDGEIFCGPLSGNEVFISFKADSIKITYTNNLPQKYGNNKFKVGIEQIMGTCQLIPEDPAVQRITNLNHRNSKKIDASSNEVGNDRYLIKMSIGQHFRDICGVVSNTVEQALPTTFCDILSKRYNTTYCKRFCRLNYTNDVPYETKRIELALTRNSKVEEIKYEEIDCEKIV